MVTAEKKRAEGADEEAQKQDTAKQAPGFSVSYMDKSVNPWQDFYTYAAGEWIKTHPVPPDKSEYGAFNELNDWNLELLHKIADDSVADKSAAPGSFSKMVGDFYASAMDTSRIEALKFAPIDDIWQGVSQVKTADDIAKLIPKLHMQGVDAFFSSGSSTDLKDSTTYAFYLGQGGISLPDRDYYLSSNFAQVRSEFREHVAKMFMLKGIPEQQARQWADTVLSIETDMAKSSRTRDELRDDEKNYNRVDTAQLDGKYGALSLKKYLKDTGVPQTKYVVVGQPEFFDFINEQLGKRSVDDLKVYLYWQTIHAYASALHKDAKDENFDMFGRKLTGQLQQKPRWKQAIGMINGSIGEAIGKLYIDRHFDENSRKKAAELVDDILSVLRDRLQNLSWMSEPTRKQALAKLDKLNVKIGYPDKFRDYTGLDIKSDDFVGNIRRSVEFEVKRQAARVGKPVDRTEWGMTPQTVNAYYSPTENEIVFPAGILQPPFFDAKMDAAVNYGSIGAVIGHEITHGFDDQGRLYDADGNLHSWWTPDDEKQFKDRADGVVKAYGAEEPLPNMFINGNLTLGENIADLGGVSIAYEALQRRLAAEKSAAPSIDGLTQEQRFFISYAQTWRESITDQELKMRIVTDPHSPDKYRAIIPSINHPAFANAFPPATDADMAVQAKPKIGVW